jgi:hypothetical protein
VPADEYRSNRVVLRETSGEDDVRRFADTLGWPQLAAQEQDLANAVSREVAWGVGTEISLHYVEDPVTGNNYVNAWGHDKAAVDALVRIAAENLDSWSADELEQAVTTAENSQEKAKAVLRAGLAAPNEFDERFFRLISSAITDPDPVAREAGIYATAFSSYPQYRPLLRRVAETDPVDSRRDDAQLALESFDIEGVREP